MRPREPGMHLVVLSSELAHWLLIWAVKGLTCMRAAAHSFSSCGEEDALIKISFINWKMEQNKDNWTITSVHRVISSQVVYW